jgi:hypothetical protein
MSKIGLVNIEPKIVNSAYMQISRFHKQQGDTVEWWNADKVYDKVYCSKLFKFTETPDNLPQGTIYGGSGISLKKKLSKEIQQCEYDYSIYPDCEFSLVWFSRGCNRKCPFCVVPQKEGKIHSVEPKQLNANGNRVKVQDNNFFMCKKWPEHINKLLTWQTTTIGANIEFAGGIDVRTLYKKQCEALLKFRTKYQIKTAWDDPRVPMDKHFRRILQWIRPYRFMCFVLIGYWSTPEQDLMRVMKLREMKVDPFVMPYDKHDKYQKRFARWVNHKAIFKSVKWKDYR